MNIKSKSSRSKVGKRVWMLPHEMDARFGEQIAAAMRLRKESDETLAKTEIRMHPAGWRL